MSHIFYPSGFDDLPDNFVYPEFIVDKPSSSSKWMWCWSVYDPPTQGEYYGGRTESKEMALNEIEVAVLRVLREARSLTF